MMHARPFDTRLQTLVLLIIVFGLFMLTSASSIPSFERFGDSYHLVKRQFFNLLVGALGLWLMSRYEYQRLRKVALAGLLAAIVLLVVVLIPGIGLRTLGAQRWIELGPISFQPSEFAKLALIIYLATWLDRRRLSGREGGLHLRTFLVLIGVMGGLILLQPDLGTLIVLCGIAVAMYFSSGAPYRQVGLIFLVGALALLVAISVAPYRLSRLTVFLNPGTDAQGEAYHINQSLIAIGSGGLTGVGLGHSRQKFNYLPEASADSIFSVVAEETGFLMVVLLIVAYILLMLRGFRIARLAQDPFGRALAIGITSWLTIQSFVNIGALSGILPLTGVPLPFISYGGSSLIFLMVGIGILLNVSRNIRAGHGRTSN